MAPNFLLCRVIVYVVWLVSVQYSIIFLQLSLSQSTDIHTALYWHGIEGRKNITQGLYNSGTVWCGAQLGKVKRRRDTVKIKEVYRDWLVIGLVIEKE